MKAPPEEEGRIIAQGVNDVNEFYGDRLPECSLQAFPVIVGSKIL
jgi:hypothetical protein